MKLNIHYGIHSLTKDDIKYYKDNNLLVINNTFDTELVASTMLSKTYYLSPDNILYDAYGLSHDSTDVVIYFTDDKKPIILPEKYKTISLNFNVNDIKELEFSYGDTYYCRKLIKTSLLKKIYSSMLIAIPDVSDTDHVYFGNTFVYSDNIDLQIPICYWSKNGIICNNALPFLFIHSELEYIPVVFVVNKDYKYIDDQILPKPFFDNCECENINNIQMSINYFDDAFVKIKDYYRFSTNVGRNDILDTIKNLQEFPISKTIECETKKYGIIQTAHIFPNMGMKKSLLSSNELSYRWFINNYELTAFPLVFLKIKNIGEYSEFPEKIQDKMKKCNNILSPTVKSVEKKIKFVDLFKLIEPILLDQSMLTEIVKDERLDELFCKDFMPVDIDSNDTRLHIQLLVGLDILNMSVLKSYSANDDVPIVIHYYDDIRFINDDFKNKLFCTCI